MAKQITDDEDRLKRQARRRLIGAVALTTAIVVVLPMVLDREPKPVGQDIELRIPDKDKVGAFAPKIDLPPASAPVATLPASSPVIVPASVIISQPVRQENAEPAIKSASDTAKPAEIAPEHKQDQIKQDLNSEHAKPTAAVHTELRESPRSGLVLQIGAFGNEGTAHSWQKNLIQQGFKAYTEKSGNKTRVRIGPYPTREAANKARHKLEEKGLHSNIIELN